MLLIRTELEEYPEREEVIIHASALPLQLIQYLLAVEGAAGYDR